MTMAISNLLCTIRTAGLLGAALASLTMAGQDRAIAQGPWGCFVASQGEYNGTAYYTPGLANVPYKQYHPFADGDGVTITISQENGTTWSVYDFESSGVKEIGPFSGLNVGTTQQFKFDVVGESLVGGTVFLWIQNYFIVNTELVRWTCVPGPNDPPSISSVAPNTGPSAGGTSVAITGTHFTGASAVRFGGVDASSFTVSSDTSITAIAPPGTGTVDITVRNSQGSSFATSGDKFTYSGSPTPVPTVTSTSRAGPPWAGTEVDITGTNFATGVNYVKFGTIPAKGFVVTSPTTLVALAPDTTASTGTMDITVTNGAGTSATSAADQFTSTIANTHSYSGDGKSDLLWLDNSGNAGLWLMNGSQVARAGGLGNVGTAWSVVGQRDFNYGDNADILWRDNSGDLALWFMNGLQVSSSASLGNVPTSWTVVGTGGFSDHGIGQILWRDTAGDLAVWLMNGAQVVFTAGVGNVPTNWSTVGEDSLGNIFWRDTAGDVAVWQVSGSQVVQSASLGNVPSNWVIAGVGDFNGDGATDILWRDTTSGTVAIWFLNSVFAIQSTASLGAVPNTWSIAQTGDYNGDGKTDILWIDDTGNVAIWFINGSTVASTAGLGNVGTSWSVQALNAE
jgi:IPT/TIG domain/FG-GAP-like repeat